MALWSFSKAPLILDTDVVGGQLSTTAQTVLGKQSLIDVNQNAESQAYCVMNCNSQKTFSVYVTEQKDKRMTYVMFINWQSTSQTVKVKLSEIGVFPTGQANYNIVQRNLVANNKVSKTYVWDASLLKKSAGTSVDMLLNGAAGLTLAKNSVKTYSFEAQPGPKPNSGTILWLNWQWYNLAILWHSILLLLGICIIYRTKDNIYKISDNL